MKFSEQWLREWVNPAVDTAGLAHQITMAGLEVDGFEAVAGPFSGVVVGEVLSVIQHPDADKLRICQVSDGQSVTQVVCGAPNVRGGLRVPFAQVGAVLPGDFRIRKAKLRGVESSGMLCSASELGISDDASGLFELPADAPVGTSLRDYLQLDDYSIDVDLTPNRSDCLSIRGLAREVGVINRVPVEEPEVGAVAATHRDVLDVQVTAPDACPRYVGRIVRGVNPQAQTPLWMRERLRRSGIRSLGPAVDVTNYVMLELGQPMHAFDLAMIEGGIDVRMAREGETLVLLDGQEIKLGTDTLVISDHHKPLAMAGVMGGEHSGVSDQTRDLFLESAFFEPVMLAGKARRHGLHTDSSHRFERGVDHALQRKAMERATQLILDIMGGAAGEIIEVASKAHLPAVAPVRLREARLAQLLGVHIDRTETEEILTRLGLQIDKLLADGWQVRVPSFRFDICQEVDLIEEVGRVYGYNRLPVSAPRVPLSLRMHDEGRRPLARVLDHFVSLGYQEAVTYSFVDPKVQALLDPACEPIALANPISADMSVMRTTLWSGLLPTLVYNQNRQQSRIRLFETGLRFRQVAGHIQQDPMLAGVVSGSRFPEGWSQARQVVDFYDVKGELESLASLLGIELSFRKATHPALHPGQCASLWRGDVQVGYVGLLHPQAQKVLDINGAVYLFELSLNPILTGYVPNFQEFSKFPEVRRDLAILVGKAVSYADVEAAVRSAAGEHLRAVRVFDLYEGERIAPDHKSLALSVFWQHPERTLNDEDVALLFDAVVQHVQARLGATLRS